MKSQKAASPTKNSLEERQFFVIFAFTQRVIEIVPV